MDMIEDLAPPPVAVEPAETAPVRVISPEGLKALGQNLDSLFNQYRSDRRIAELKWLRNLRQYLGIYDPEIEKQLSPNRSQAYPKITRIKCVSVVARLMNLMFPGNEKNWELKASPSAEMSPDDVMAAVEAAMQRHMAAGVQPQITDEMVQDAVQRLANERAKKLSALIDDQLQELGGDQTLDYIALNRQVVRSGVLYGLGVLRGPFVRAENHISWNMGPLGPTPSVMTSYKPQYEFLPVWDFYPDMAAKTLARGDGYFVRMVMTRSQLRKLADREDFFETQIKGYLRQNSTGNYKAQPFETELRSMGVKVNVNEAKPETQKYEVLIWNGPITGEQLKAAGVEIEDDKLIDEIDAEVWMVGGVVIKADINPWRKLGIDVRTIHTFQFDEDDTSPIGNGLPNVMRDSQMSIAAATRMLLDNASVVCGPNLELNTDLLRADQDLTSVQAYKIWYREGQGADANMPAIRNVAIDSHMDELLKIIELFMRFADQETFVGPATGGDMERKAAGEPMRTAAGASMMRADAALPFKDIVRNFDTFTQSVILSLVQFNKKFMPNEAVEGDYNVIARGATSLIAKEVRGMQLDQLAVSLTPDERVHIDERRFVEARFAVRDLEDMLIPEDEAKLKQAQQAQQAQDMQAKQDQVMAAELRKTAAETYKNIAQGQKNSANADTALAKSALELVNNGLGGDDGEQQDSGGKPARAAAKQGRNA